VVAGRSLTELGEKMNGYPVSLVWHVIGQLLVVV